MNRFFKTTALVFAMCLTVATSGLCVDISLETARTVAQNKLQHHIALYGDWNGSLTPVIADRQTVIRDTVAVAYLFRVTPSGYILVNVDDEFSPIPMYSARSTFDPNRADDPNAIESWIIPELDKKMGALNDYRRRASLTKSLRVRSDSPVKRRIDRAWDYFKQPSLNSTVVQSGKTSTAVLKNGSTPRTAPGDILLTTIWDQSAPYNQATPDDSCNEGHTLTGCVATAWAQVLKHWEHPNQEYPGMGSHSYLWNGQTLTVDFGAATYDWDHMPDELTDDSDDAQKEAVSLLMYHVGVATEMDYGCSSSGSNAYANDVLDTYFNYKAMDIYDRQDYLPAEWFTLFKDELDAATPRPVIFSIFAEVGGHEVVVDGYQNDPEDKVHINFGWSGSSDGFYDVTDDDNFNTGTSPNDISWYVDYQYIVTGIEPNTDPRPVVNAGSDRTVNERTTVQLTGSVTDQTADVSQYKWIQVNKTISNEVTISNDDSQNASFTAPSVSSNTDLVFIFKGIDDLRAVGFDKVTITVRNTDSSSSGGGGGSSGSSGCFITSLVN